MYKLANDDSSADFKVEITSTSGNPGIDAAAAVMIECGGVTGISCADGQIVDTSHSKAPEAMAESVGSDRGDEAQNIMAAIDQDISALPAQTP